MAPRSLSGRILQHRLARRAGTVLHPLQGIRLGRLEADVQFQQLPAHPHPCGEVPVHGQPGELPQQVKGVLLPVGGVVEHGVGVGEDVLGGDAIVAVVLPELPQTPTR